MGKRSEIRQALRYAKSELKSAMSDKYISESELYNIVNATFELKALGASGRQLNKADKIYSKAVKFFSETNTVYFYFW